MAGNAIFEFSTGKLGKFVADGRTDYVKFSHELTETE